MVNKDIRDMSRREKDSLIRQLEHVRVEQQAKMNEISVKINEHHKAIEKLIQERNAASQRISDAEQSIAYLSD